jgi:predicted amidophosphoribosyltransferase
MVLGLVIWTPFMVGAILYSNYYQRQGVRICPNCGKYAYKGKTYCEKCGARIFWQCPKCHARTSKGLKFCKDCGQSLKVVTFAHQVEFEDAKEDEENIPDTNTNNLVVTGSILKFCPSCGAEIEEDLTHCSICGSKFEN